MNRRNLIAVSVVVVGLVQASAISPYGPQLAGAAANRRAPPAEGDATGTPPPVLRLALSLGESVDIRCPEGGRLTLLPQGTELMDVTCELMVVPETPTPTPFNRPSATPTSLVGPSATATARVAPTTAPTTLPAGPPAPGAGVWISRSEVLELPMSGTAWQSLLSAAGGNAGSPSLCNQNSSNNALVLAKALAYARTGEARYRNDVRQNVMGAIGTENGGSCRSLALGRELAAYVVAADLVGLEAGEDATFRSWLAAVRTKKLGDGRSIVSCHEDRPNNWGTMCGASRAAASAYLRDRTDLDRTAAVFKGYVGDRAAYAGFAYGDLSWQADADKPVGINPRGALKLGVDIDGVIPDDMRRGSGFTTGCPASTGYPWEALQGVVVQAEILHRQGYDAWSWQSQAVRRAVQYLYNLNQRCSGWTSEATSGDDRFIPWIVNHVYGTGFAAASPADYGKIMGWTDWTHNRATRERR